MAQDNVFRIEVEALDAEEGYVIKGLSIVDGARTMINEHRSLRVDVRARLAAGFDAWAAQVDREPIP